MNGMLRTASSSAAAARGSDDLIEQSLMLTPLGVYVRVGQVSISDAVVRAALYPELDSPVPRPAHPWAAAGRSTVRTPSTSQEARREQTLAGGATTSSTVSRDVRRHGQAAVLWTLQHGT